MTEEKTYNQFEKKKVRHMSIMEAINQLTIHRNDACSVAPNYVRMVYDYFTLSTDGSSNIREAKDIDVKYIREWEKLHASYVGSKKPEDLCVCYLCGPEPKNDFEEFISKGVLPNNIWAFELDGNTYKKAISSFNEKEFPQPRIIKQHFESFMRDTPKKFDIIYVDSCGAIPSSQHALKCITSICKNQRLESPGIILSNFTEPDANEIIDYVELVTLYMYTKTNSITDVNDLGSKKYQEFKQDVINNFYTYYSDFISSVLRDIPAVIVPLQRLSNNQYLKNIFELEDVRKKTCEEYLEKAKTHSVANFFLIVESLRSKENLNKKISSFLKELDDYKSLIAGIKLVLDINDINLHKKQELNELKAMFEGKQIYQFLDRVHINMVYDIVINQLTYPYHNVLSANKRYMYTAKQKRMYMDLTIYDECRYLYEWLPAVDQLKSALLNKSWQYVFRFGLDGLIKQRKDYNNEFFFQGAVISSSVEEFAAVRIKNRILVEE